MEAMVLAEKQGLVYQPDDLIDDPTEFPDMVVEATGGRNEAHEGHDVDLSIPDAPGAEIPSTSIIVSAKDMTSARNSYIFAKSPLGNKTKAALVAILVENEVSVATFDME
jgi:hypothetical protein